MGNKKRTPEEVKKLDALTKRVRATYKKNWDVKKKEANKRLGNN